VISFGFNLANPWSKRWENIWCRIYDTPFKSKYIELEAIKDGTIMSFSFKLATRQDHPGLTIEAGLLGYSLLFQFYDIRHWNSKEGRFYIYNEEEGWH
jgi:hypothetical protein